MAKKPLSENQKIIRDDILLYKNNKLASTLALLGLAFSCLYFMLLYSFNYDFYYKMMMGFSVVLTLFLLLIAFYSSEGIKAYNKKFSIILIILAAFQILKIFYFPLNGLREDVLRGNYFEANLSSAASFTILVIYLVASAACFAASAVWGFIVAQRLENYKKKLDDGEVDINRVLKDMDAEDEAAKATTADTAGVEAPAADSEEVQ